ncbi:hypothetical protein ACIPUN_02085 [Pectobacterium sp. CHL-2024]
MAASAAYLAYWLTVSGGYCRPVLAPSGRLSMSERMTTELAYNALKMAL